MEAFYDFTVLALSPSDSRDERINIGLAVLRKDGVDVRLGKRLEKVRAISAAIDIEELRALVDNVKLIDQKSGVSDLSGRLGVLSSLAPLAVSQPGVFQARSADEYEARIAGLLSALVDAEPTTKTLRIKRSRLVTQVKTLLRRERVLAAPGEQLDSHRILAGYELDEGLVADFVLRNGAMHVVETVQASADSTARRLISEIGVAALVLERARMRFGDKKTNAQLVYDASAAMEKVVEPSLEAAAHQGAKLVNWGSSDQRTKFIESLSSLATPRERKRPMGGVRFAAPN